MPESKGQHHRLFLPDPANQRAAPVPLGSRSSPRNRPVCRQAPAHRTIPNSLWSYRVRRMVSLTTSRKKKQSPNPLGSPFSFRHQCRYERNLQKAHCRDPRTAEETRSSGGIPQSFPFHPFRDYYGFKFASVTPSASNARGIHCVAINQANVFRSRPIFWSSV